jgi:hypothetical protein
MSARTINGALLALPLLLVAAQPSHAFDGEVTRPMDRVREATVARPAPPPRPDKLLVPFSAPQSFIDHARFFKEEVINVGPNRIWMINTPGGGIGNIAVLEGDKGVVLVDTSTGTEFAERARATSSAGSARSTGCVRSTRNTWCPATVRS